VWVIIGREIIDRENRRKRREKTKGKEGEERKYKGEWVSDFVVSLSEVIMGFFMIP